MTIGMVVNANRNYYWSVNPRTNLNGSGSHAAFLDSIDAAETAEKKEAVGTETESLPESSRPSGRERVEELVQQYGEDAPYSKALRAIEQSFDATFPGMPDDVKDTWIDMCIDSGVNQITGISLDGKHAHISQIMIQKFVQEYNMSNGNYQYVEPGWGESIDSMIRILKKGIHDIDYPLPGQATRSDEVEKLVAKERDFYAAFLDRMGW